MKPVESKASTPPAAASAAVASPAAKPASTLEMQALLDATLDAIILIDHRGIVQVFNRAAERLFGYSASEVIGHNVNMLMTDPERGQHDAYLERYLRTGIPHIIGVGREVTARRRDGTLVPAFLSVGRVEGYDPPHFVGLLHDMTLRHQAVAAAERERDRANRYLEAAQSMLVGLDARHRVTMINPRGCEVLGCTPDALVGKDWFSSVVAPASRQSAAEELNAMLQRRARAPLQCEYPIITSRGEQRLISWHCIVVADGQGAVEALCSGEDVTEGRRAEDEVRETRERMMHVSRLATMGEMASGISHELNQPLAAIANYAQASIRLLSGEAPDLADLREAQQQIAAQALRAGEIIRRLRSLVGRRKTVRESCNLNDVIAELEPLTRADARASDVRITTQLATDLPPVMLDRIQMQQVVLNLVRNAIEASADTPAEQRHIAISTGTTEDGMVYVKVADRGPGVPEQIAQRLFTPFLTTKENGTGLGLAISRSIAEAHRGRLEYRPNTPSGAAFVVTLPIVIAEVAGA